MYNDISLVINKDIFEVIKEVAVCPLCKGVISNPVQCSSCENCFCKLCAYESKKDEKGCPFECKDFLLRKCPILSKLLLKLNFQCCRKCGVDSISYKDLEEHYFNKCTLRLKEGEKSYMSQYHPHLLVKHIGDSHFRCDICKESVEGDSVCYSCRKCDFDYCDLCRQVEEEGKQ